MSDEKTSRELSLADRLEHSAEAAQLDDATRRSFLQAAGGAVIGAAALVGGRRQLLQITHPEADRGLRQSPRGEYPASFANLVLRVNGNTRALKVPHQRTLLLALREDLGLTGTKKSCNLGQCGACTVLLDGMPVYSCLTLALDASEHEITTIEGIANGGALHPVQEGFIQCMGSQCGHCTPGMIMSAAGLLQHNPSPSHEDVKTALSGNLCRCGNYPNEVAAVMYAASRMRAEEASAPGTPNARGALSLPAQIVTNGATPIAGLASSVPILDAREKALGTAKYAGDFGFHAEFGDKPLVAKVVRSPYALADVLDIDDSEARTVPGYRGMVTFRDVPGYRAPGAQNERSPAVTDRLFLNGRAR